MTEDKPIEEKVESVMKLVRKNFEKVQLNSLRTGARMICGAVLGFAARDGTDSEKLAEIVKFCEDTIGKTESEEVSE